MHKIQIQLLMLLVLLMVNKNVAHQLQALEQNGNNFSRNLQLQLETLALKHHATVGRQLHPRLSHKTAGDSKHPLRVIARVVSNPKRAKDAGILRKAHGERVAFGLSTKSLQKLEACAYTPEKCSAVDSLRAIFMVSRPDSCGLVWVTAAGGWFDLHPDTSVSLELDKQGRWHSFRDTVVLAGRQRVF
ncbi:hypothetical protein DUNSADRAFT_7720 [Dunaliella salina]|uniref:Uncharacterized protein n=1 Tax=Dunaliella salina TaxID=3046 RepID=A0ABQ7GKV2_DUNSA|nr:hypothetical protein DUNSADRAFT_7720 [Dunaliella salina]|eukprot:KAF5835231.1 hypothetical protein DUNSADRAFT_7720 [Dunaliella salina]